MDSFGPFTWAHFQKDEAHPTSADVTTYFDIHFYHQDDCVQDFYDISVLVGCWSSVSIKSIICKILCVSFWFHSCWEEWEGWVRKPVKHSNWMIVVSPTNRPMSVCSRCVILHFGSVLCGVTLSLLNFLLA